MGGKLFSTLAVSALALSAATAFASGVTLYEGQGFRGRSAAVIDAAPDLTITTLAGGASSVIVTEGTWEACTDTYFRGRCGQLVSGNYSALSGTLNGAVLSVRQIQSVSSRILVSPDRVAIATVPERVVVSPAPATVVVNPAPAALVVSPAPQAIVVNQPAQVVAAAPVVAVAPSPPGRAVLFQYPNFGGPAAVVEHARMPDLDWANFRYPAASLRIESGNWVACTEMGYQGECRVLGPGDYPALTGVLDRGISSLRPLA